MTSRIFGKNILIGITGSIAAYKICELIRMLVKAGANVKTIVTPAALEFVGTKSLETISRNPVYLEQFAPAANVEHITLCDWADLFIIAPISANTISKFANGIADNLLTSVFCAYMGSNKPSIIAPTMNTGMINNPFVIENIKKLEKLGVTIIDSIVGELACGYAGKGKMSEVATIFEKAKEAFAPRLSKKIIITAGGTKEYIDPVRFITNASSGKMGIALADAAFSMGYDVELICTMNVSDKPYTITPVSSAIEMKNAVEKSFKDANVLIMAAAVGDFKVKNYSEEKISKEKMQNESLEIELVKNPDILKYIGEIKKEGQTVIGFSLATSDVVETGKVKLQDKKCDFIIANEAKTALNQDTNEVWIIDKAQNITRIEKNTKDNIAKSILELVL